MIQKKIVQDSVSGSSDGLDFTSGYPSDHHLVKVSIHLCCSIFENSLYLVESGKHVMMVCKLHDNGGIRVLDGSMIPLE